MRFFPCRSGSEVSYDEAILYASGMIILSGIGVLTINQLFMTGYYNGIQINTLKMAIFKT